MGQEVQSFMTFTPTFPQPFTPRWAGPHLNGERWKSVGHNHLSGTWLLGVQGPLALGECSMALPSLPLSHPPTSLSQSLALCQAAGPPCLLAAA